MSKGARIVAVALGLVCMTWSGIILAQPTGEAPAADPSVGEPAAPSADSAAALPVADDGPAVQPSPPPARVAPPVAPVEAAAPPEPAEGKSWKQRFESFLEDDAVVVGKQVLLALLLFLAGWFLAKFLSWIVYRVLCRTTLDDKLADKLGISEFMGQKGGDSGNNVERFVARVVYYLLMLLVVIAVLQFAGFTEAAAPIQSFVDKITAALPLVGKAVLILLIAYFGGLILKKMVTRFLDGARVDARFAELSRPKDSADAESDSDERPFSEAAGLVVFWLMMVFGLAGAVDALQIGPLAHAMRNVVDQIISVLPAIGIAAVLVIAGYALGRIARAIIDNLLDSAGFNKLTAKLQLEKIFGDTKASYVVGYAAMIFIILQASIAALDELALEPLSGPLTEMMAQFWNFLPLLAVAILIIAAGIIAARVVRGIVEKALTNLEFDDMMKRLGFGEISGRGESLSKPHQLVGLIAQIAIVLLATVQALDKLALYLWADHLNSFLGYSVTHVAVALVIVAIGFAIGNYVRDLILARQRSEEDESLRWMGAFARYGILVFAITMAVHHLDVGPNFVLISFALLFGGLCLALALALGLGSREVAGEIVRRHYERARREFAQGAAKPATPGKPALPVKGATDK